MFHFAIPPAERVHGNDLDAGLDQVVPALDLLRVAVAQAEDDDGVPDDAVVALLVPVLVDQALVDQVVDVVARVEDHAVGREAVRDRLALRRGRPVRGPDVDAGALRRLLELGDQLVEATAAASSTRRGSASRPAWPPRSRCREHRRNGGQRDHQRKNTSLHGTNPS